MRGFSIHIVAVALSLSIAPGQAIGNAPPQVPLAANGGLPESRSRGNPLNNQFKEYIDLVREDLHVPGLSIGVVDGDETYLEVSSPTFFVWGIVGTWHASS